jgi:RND family efflux transporter MFP subunit
MNKNRKRVTTVTIKAPTAKPEREAGSRMMWPVQIRVALWQEVSFVPLVSRVCASASAPNHSKNSNTQDVPMITHSVPILRNGRAGSSMLMLLGVAFVFAGCGKPPAKAPEKNLVRTAVVESADKVRSDGDASYLASVKFDHETDLSFKVGGILDKIGPTAGTDWDEGMPVKAGVVLAELKQADFNNALNSARARGELMNKTLERFRKLRATDAISQQELDITEADWRTAQAQLEQAEQNLRDSRLVAAQDGVVLARYVNSRVTAGQGQRVLRFADTSLMSVELGLPDRLIGRVAPGKELPVEVSGLEGMPPFKGRVTEVGVAASGEGRLFRVVIKVPNPDGLLRSGMTARIHMNDAAVVKPATVVVPLSALVTFAPGTQVGVFGVQDGKAVKHLVKTGDILNSSILITEGLRAGEQVVTAGASFLYDGAPITISN